MGLLLKLCALLTAVMVVGLAAALGSARLPMRDPFAPYLRITPGHSIEALSDYSCEPLTFMNNDGEVGYCYFDPRDGVFRQIRVGVDNQIITTLTFIIIPYQITLGDAILCWGMPINTTPWYPIAMNEFNLYWSSDILGLVSPLVNLERPDYSLPITFISIAPQSKAFDEAQLLCR